MSINILTAAKVFGFFIFNEVMMLALGISLLSDDNYFAPEPQESKSRWLF